MRFSLFFVLCILSLSVSSRAAEIGWDSRIATGQLDNGLRYFLYDSGKDADPFNIRLIVHAGSIDEEVPSGVAHILEHMVFQSNAARGRTMHEEIEALGWRTGVQINAVTREAETQFMVRTRPSDALDLSASLQFLADLVMKPSLQAEDWEKERFVILEELRQTESVAARVGRLKKAALRPGSRYVDRPTIGTAAGIARTSITDIHRFYEQFYRASNMTLIVSGRVDKTQARQALESAFGSAPALAAPNRDYRIMPLKRGLNVALVQDPAGSSSQVTYAFRVAMPDRLTEDGQFAYLQQYLLTRLIRDMVEAEAPYHAAVARSLGFVAQEPTEGRQILAFNAGTQEHDAATLVLLETVERLRRQGVSRDGFEALVSRVRLMNANNREAAESRTYAEWEDRIASAVLTGSVVDDPSVRTRRTAALLDRITFEGLNTRLREILDTGDQTLFYQVPGGRRVTLPNAEAIEAENDRLAGLAALPADRALPSKPEAVEMPTWPEDHVVATSGVIVDEQERTDPHVIEWQLSNGDKVVWLVRDTPDGKVYISGQSYPGFMNSQFDSVASQAALQLFSQSGFRFWSEDQNDLWTGSLKNRWSFVLHAGHLDAGLAASPEDLPAQLKTYAQTIAFGGVREEAVDALREQFDMSRADKTSEIREQLLFGHAESDGDVQALTSLDAADLTRIAHAHLLQPVTWFVVGDKPDDSMRDSFAGVIGAVERAKSIASDVAFQRPGRHEAQVEVFSDDRARVEISFYASMDWTPEASFLISSLTPLAQQGLKKELRNVLGGIYSLEFELKLEPGQDRAIGTLAFNCAPGRTKELTQAALSVLDRMPEIARQADSEKIRADIAFAEESRLTDPNTWLRRLALSYRRYGDAGYLRRMRGLGDKVTPQRLEAHARHIFRSDNVAVLTKLPMANEVERSKTGVK